MNEFAEDDSLQKTVSRLMDDIVKIGDSQVEQMGYINDVAQTVATVLENESKMMKTMKTIIAAPTGKKDDGESES